MSCEIIFFWEDKMIPPHMDGQQDELCFGIAHKTGNTLAV
jgi:hypothetical protein